jgi:hypothetical protein
VIVRSHGMYEVRSHSGRVMGRYRTRREALARLRAIEYFKHHPRARRRQAKDNPLPALAWVAIALAGAAAVGGVVYVATKNSSSSTPAPAPTAATGSLPATNVAPTAAPSAPALGPLPATNVAPTPPQLTQTQMGAQAAQSAAAAGATAQLQSLLNNPTYFEDLSANASILLKVGDTVRVVASMDGSPPVTLANVYTLSGAALKSLGPTSAGNDCVYQAVAAGTSIVSAKIVQQANVSISYASYLLTVTVSS